ncbi:GNAT family N-acetyltransferase [Rheinheimera sp. 4Y26]|uniref:GNAT family N-acetyltransferase n=1 Tax=Rheinheimera sp. 4Y26 TaxID=2977811 RepID=UPI0021B0E982|nr:GNAT family N-acetyltransferase [Rheinheimera sp. 4Y26]MCT6699219.1 GNAT family N-acetyltransferase [Rheinheimera sp. 4Y26]
MISTNLPQKTQKTTIVSVSQAHQPLFHELYGNQRIMRNIAETYSEEKINSLLRSCINAELKAIPLKRFLVIECNTRNIAVGLLSIQPTHIPDAPIELGMMLTTKAWGKGIADEALISLCLYCFKVLNAPAVLARFHPENKSARAICFRLGYQHAPRIYQQPELETLWLQNTISNKTAFSSRLFS